MGIDPSHSFRMTPCRPSSFWMGTRIPCKKGGKWNNDNEWRIYSSDDTLLYSSPRVQILHVRSGWRLTFPSLWQQILCWRSGWRFSFLVIMTLSLNRHSERGKNAVWERWETATWQWVKNLFPWWHLTVLLTTAGDPSLWRLMFLVIQLKFIMLF